MKDDIFDIAFEQEGKVYKGWVNPAEKLNEDGQPASYHVVLNGVSFGYLSFKDCEWTINENRPEAAEAQRRGEGAKKSMCPYDPMCLCGKAYAALILLVTL